MGLELYLQVLEDAPEVLKAIPLWGSPPPFPWESLSKRIGQTFEQEGLAFKLHKSEWLKGDSLYEGMGPDPLIQPLALSPLPGYITVVLPKKSQDELIKIVMSKNSGKGTLSSSIEEGLTHFVLLNSLNAFNQINPYGNLTATLSDDTFEEEEALTIDIAITNRQDSFWARLLIAAPFLDAFRSYFTMEKPPILTDKTLTNLPLNLYLTAGHTTLTQNEWGDLEVGDFLLLDTCTYEKKGGLLSLGQTPLFDVRFEEKGVKLLEYALIQEEKPMTQEDIPERHQEEGDESDPLWSADGPHEETLEPISHVPLTLTVEVAQLQMPLEKVSQLQPGNVLDLEKGQDMIVHLTAGGKRVAKGELVKLGDTLGVKILVKG